MRFEKRLPKSKVPSPIIRAKTLESGINSVLKPRKRSKPATAKS
ncbi:MAG: hypothetical protein M2R45_05095 [Verrucomicrobia subdivision 3 bacterium]|nr:hypothetical protein [Limisphaerales bacterium]MCS1417171.1 hypothetical protein [Limisphaerales bacterium]